MASYPDYAFSAKGYIDLVAVNGSLLNKAVTIQNKGSGVVYVYEGGDTQPNGGPQGIAVAPMNGVNVNSANVWVYGDQRQLLGITDTK